MGIPRLTRDLQPYLQNAILSRKAVTNEVLVHDLVIDGPSMVHHVYNRILPSQDIARVCDVPTYSFLNLAIHQFLSDIEACGVKM